MELANLLVTLTWNGPDMKILLFNNFEISSLLAFFNLEQIEGWNTGKQLNATSQFL